MKHKKTFIIISLVVVCILLAVVPLLSEKGASFSGADDAAGNVVAEVDPGYTPWADNVITLPGSETESLLFCLQSALGAGVLFFCFGYLTARKKYRKEDAKK